MTFQPFSLTVAIKTENPLNGSHLHWRTVAARRKKQRKAVSNEWAVRDYAERGFAMRASRAMAALHVEREGLCITLTRLSAGELDDDAVGAALKSVRDQVAAILGVENDRDPRYTWRYRQEKAPKGKPGVRVEIEERE